MIPVKCLQCQHAWDADQDQAGMKVKCPNCGQPRRVPGGRENFEKRAEQREHASEEQEVKAEELRFVGANLLFGLGAILFGALTFSDARAEGQTYPFYLLGFGVLIMAVGIAYQVTKDSKVMYGGVGVWILAILSPVAAMLQAAGPDWPLVLGEALKFVAIVGFVSVVQFQAVYAIVRKRQRVDERAAAKDYQG